MDWREDGVNIHQQCHLHITAACGQQLWDGLETVSFKPLGKNRALMPWLSTSKSLRDVADLFDLLHKICTVCYCEPLKEQSISLSTKQQWKEAHRSSHWLSTKGITSHDSSSMAQGQEWNVTLCAVGGETEGWEDKRMCRVNTERQYQELRVALSLNRMQGSCREKETETQGGS